MNRALVILLFPILCLGWVAQASAAEWGIEEKSLAQLGLKEETVTSSQGPIAMETTTGLAKERIVCEQIKSTGRILSPSKGELTVEFSKCTTALNGKSAPECAPKEPIVSKVSSELRDDATKLVVYDFLKPQTGTTFITYEFSAKCAIGTKLVISGETAAQVPQGMLVNRPLNFSEAIAKAAGTKLTTAASLAAYFNGTWLVQLSGKNLGKTWGSCLACNYKKEEGYGPENPGNPNICKICQGDPVDPASGDLTESQTDLSVHGRGPALEVVRTYDSQRAATQKTAGAFGFGWTGPYSAYLEVIGETAVVHHDNGSTVAFSLAEGKNEAKPWTESTLVKSGENYIYTLPDQEKLEFNSSGLLVKVSDRHGNPLALGYKEGRLNTVEDAAGRTLTFTYNKAGEVEGIKDPMGHVVKYTYEAENLATVTLPGEEKARWTFGYGAAHLLTAITDGRGNTTKNEYDGSNRITLQTDRVGNKLKFEYKEKEGVKETTTTEPNGSTTVERFNQAGEPTEVTKASGTELAQTTRFEYNSALALIKVTDPNSHVTTYGYDSLGNRTSKKDANENEGKWVYNITHDLVEETTPRGNTTTFARNTAGDVKTVTRLAPGGKTQETIFKYAANGDLEEETDPVGRTTKFEYDSYGNRQTMIDAAGDKRTWGYDTDGELTSEVSPRGNEEGAKASEFETKIKRDPQGRPETLISPLGYESKYEYDPNGNVKAITDPNGRTTTFVYDAEDRRTEIEAANGNVTKTVYDAEGKVISKTDGNGNTTKYERNALEQLTEVIDPLLRKTTCQYDAAGNLKEVKDPTGRTITYTYDPGNRLKEVNYSDAGTPDVSYKYDKDGNVTEMTDGTGTTKKAYDILGRLTEVENGNKEVIKYEYDLAGEKTKITYPNGEFITQAFDNAGRLEKITDWLGGETKFSYTRDSLPKATIFPSASENEDKYEYNPADQLTQTTMKKGATTLASISYARDNAGQLKSIAQSGLPGAEKGEYIYDEKERLKEGAGASFAYDAANNPTTLGGSTLEYDKASQLEKGGKTAYTFDELGERTKATPETDPATTYGYDQAGNLISVKRPEEGGFKKIEDSYTYDGNKLRASETVSGKTTHMAWDVTEKLPQLLYDGTNYYIYGPGGLPVAQINSKKEPTYLHHDQQGSTRLLTNSTGEVAGTYTYTPYGAIEGESGSATTPLGYGGQYTDASTKLIYLRARVYDPSTAQFLSIDPQVAKTVEPYAYAAGNPVNAGDPSGELVFGIGNAGFQLGPINANWPVAVPMPFLCPILAAYNAIANAVSFAWQTFFNQISAYNMALTSMWNMYNALSFVNTLSLLAMAQQIMNMMFPPMPFGP